MAAEGRQRARLTFVPQAKAMTVAAMTDTTRVFLDEASDILPPTAHLRTRGSCSLCKQHRVRHPGIEPPSASTELPSGNVVLWSRSRSDFNRASDVTPEVLQKVTVDAACEPCESRQDCSLLP